MTIQQFIERAIEGGWQKPFITNSRVATLARYKTNYSVVLFDPEAWKAVGKVEGWGLYCVTHRSSDCHDKKGAYASRTRWVCEMHRLIDHLAEGKSIESYLAGL